MEREASSRTGTPRAGDDAAGGAGADSRAGAGTGSRSAARLIGATLLFSSWFLLLLFGHPLGPAVHLLLLAALLAVPWRLLHP